MGEAYLEYAPKLVRPVLSLLQPPPHFKSMNLPICQSTNSNISNRTTQGYKYSVFNLVFANNPASIRIWEKLGFGVIGRVPRAARLANSEELVDALIFGRDLGV